MSGEEAAAAAVMVVEVVRTSVAAWSPGAAVGYDDDDDDDDEVAEGILPSLYNPAEMKSSRNDLKHEIQLVPKHSKFVENLTLPLGQELSIRICWFQS